MPAAVQAFAHGQGLCQRLGGAAIVVAVVAQHADQAQRSRHVGMFGPDRGAIGNQSALMHRLAAIKVAIGRQRAADIVERARQARIARWKMLLANGQRFAVQRFGGRILAAVHVQVAQVGDRVGQIERIGVRSAAPDRQRALQVRQCAIGHLQSQVRAANGVVQCGENLRLAGGGFLVEAR